MKIDRNGQPEPFINAKRRGERDIQRLIGMAEGVLMDGVVTQQEAEALQAWLEKNQSIARKWPANVMYERIGRMLEDGVLDADEERELMALLLDVTGGPPPTEELSAPSRLPLCSPAPEVVFVDRSFCVTGKLFSGSRREAHALIEAKGGRVAERITKSLDYLVVGEVGSRDWLTSAFGNKIIKAVEYRDSGVPVSIVSEEH